MTTFSTSIKSKMPASTVTKGKALVADDKRSNRMILSAILKQIGYEVIQAENGVEAVELFQTEKPDIILIDIIMPVMDGYNAVKQIKSDPANSFTPVLFLTGMTDEQDLAKCIEVGGDDFLTKPFNRTLLTAKIHALERISILHKQVNVLYARTQQDQEMAKEVFAGAVITDNVALNAIQTLSQPAELFSGDVLLSAYSPSGDLNVMMGDFTGHGLAAALGAMPASEVFRAMTSKGYSTQQILAGINSKLLNILPTSMFLAIQFITLSKYLDYVSVCNCGMPDILFLGTDDHIIKHRAPSSEIPLGISTDIDFNECVKLVKIDLGDTILLASDGVTEALNNNKEPFTNKRLESAISERQAGKSTIDSISNALQVFCGGASQADDISLAEIPCTPEVLQAIKCDTTDNQYETKSVTDFNCSSNINRVDFNISLYGRRLSDTDPIPILINHIHEIEGLAEHRRLLFTILTELYTNSLDNGVLGLHSDIKNEMDGFSNYFTAREKRLEQLTDGYVTIAISSCTTPNGGEMIITVKDSGSGFNYSDYKCDKSDYSKLSGRGIQLLTGLCSSITYIEPGNHVEAIYSWCDS